MDTVQIDPDNDGPAYRLTVLYGRASGGRLEAGGDSDAAVWVDLDEIEALPMTPGSAESIWIAAHRVRGV